MNVLITSAAAKVLLVRSFQRAVASSGGKVIAADISPYSVALYMADEAVLLPPDTSPDFADALLAFCGEKDIRLIVPTRDAELAVFAECKERFQGAGVTVLVPAGEVLDICQDKRRFIEYCKQHDWPVAQDYDPSQTPPCFPVFVRPAKGAAGKGARQIETIEQWQAISAEARSKLVVQDIVEAPEYTVDVLLGLNGEPLQACARLRIRTLAGESQIGRIEDRPELTDSALRLCAELGLVGHVTVQAFFGEDGLSFIEINPRFGGGSNLSIEAGLASPERIVQLVMGDTSALASREIKMNLVMLRYRDDLILLEEDMEDIPRCR